MDAPKNVEKSSLGGIDANIAGLLSWLIPLVALIVVIIEKDSKFSKFHAWQALSWDVVYFVAAFILPFGFGILSAAAPTGLDAIISLVSLCLSCLTFFLFIVNIYGAVKAYNKEMWKLPMLGDFAEKQANK